MIDKKLDFLRKTFGKMGSMTGDYFNDFMARLYIIGDIELASLKESCPTLTQEQLEFLSSKRVEYDEIKKMS